MDSDVTASCLTTPHRPSASSDAGRLFQFLSACVISPAFMNPSMSQGLWRQEPVCFYQTLSASPAIQPLGNSQSFSLPIPPWSISLLTHSIPIESSHLGNDASSENLELALYLPTQHAIIPGPAHLISSKAMTKISLLTFTSEPQFSPLSLPVTIIPKKPNKDTLPPQSPCKLH